MDTLVTVLDAYNFAFILEDAESESNHKKLFSVAPEEEESDSIVQLLIDQIESAMKNFGTSLVKDINKSDKKKANRGNSKKNGDQVNLFSSVIRCKGELCMSDANCCPIDVHFSTCYCVCNCYNTGTYDA